MADAQTNEVETTQHHFQNAVSTVTKTVLNSINVFTKATWNSWDQYECKGTMNVGFCAHKIITKTFLK